MASKTLYELDERSTLTLSDLIPINANSDISGLNKISIQQLKEFMIDIDTYVIDLTATTTEQKAIFNNIYSRYNNNKSIVVYIAKNETISGIVSKVYILAEMLYSDINESLARIYVRYNVITTDTVGVSTTENTLYADIIKATGVVTGDLSTIVKTYRLYKDTYMVEQFVPSVEGKQLSTEDFTTEEKSKLALLSTDNDTTEITAEITTARGVYGSLDGRLDTMETNTSTVSSEVTTARGVYGSLDGRLDSIDTAISVIPTSALATEVTTARGSYDSLDLRLDGIDTTIGAIPSTTALTAEVTTARGAYDSLDLRLDGIDTNTSNISSEVTTARGGYGSLDGRLDSIDTAIGAIPSTAGLTSEVTTARGTYDTLDSRLDAIDTSLLEKALKRTEPILKTASYSIGLSDENTKQKCTSADTIVVTIPLYETTNLPDNFETVIIRYGDGTVTITPAEGVTLNGGIVGIPISEKYTGGLLVKMAANEWLIMGAI